MSDESYKDCEAELEATLGAGSNVHPVERLNTFIAIIQRWFPKSDDQRRVMVLYEKYLNQTEQKEIVAIRKSPRKPKTRDQIRDGSCHLDDQY